MDKGKVVVVNLISSDEETPPLVNSLLKSKTDIKARKTARKSAATNMGQLSIIPVKAESQAMPSQNSALNVKKSNVSLRKLNNPSIKQSTFSGVKSMHGSNITNSLNHSSNVIELGKNTIKPLLNGLPPVEITKKMPDLTITPVPVPSKPPGGHNSRTARKSLGSKSSRNSSPEVQIMAAKLNNSRYQNSTKISVGSSSTKYPSINNKGTLSNSSFSDSSSHSGKEPEKRRRSVEDSLYVESLKKKARKSFPTSNSQLPPSLLSTLGKGGVSITNVNNVNSVKSGLVAKKNEEEFDLKSLKTSPDLRITKINPDESVIESSHDKIQHGGRTQVSQTSMPQNSIRQNSLLKQNVTNSKSKTSIAKSKINNTPTLKLDSQKISETLFKNVSKDNTQSTVLSRNTCTNNINKPSTGKHIQNDFCTKNNPKLNKPQTRAQRGSITRNNLTKENSSFAGKKLADSKSDIMILPNSVRTQANNQKQFASATPIKSALIKTNSSKNKQKKTTSVPKESQSLKHKNSSVSTPKSSKKVTFKTPPNGVSQNLTFENHHKRIIAIKESLNHLTNKKQEEKTEMPFDNVFNTKKDLNIPPVNKRKAVIALPYVQEKKKNTVIPLPPVKDKKDIIALPYVQNEEKILLPGNPEKKDSVIPLPYNPLKKDTIIPLPYNQEKKKDTFIVIPQVEEKENDSVISLPHVEGKEKNTIILLPHVEKKNDTATHLACVEVPKMDAINPLLQVEKNDTNISLPCIDENIVQESHMLNKECESPDEESNFEESSAETTDNTNSREMVIDIPFERSHKQVTSPKLSLKRKMNTDDTPAKKVKVNNNADSEKIFPICNQDKPSTSSRTVKSTNENLFPWIETDDVSAKYKKFLHFCKSFMKISRNEENKIVKTFLKLFHKANVQFIESINFLELLQKTVLKIKQNPGEIFIHLTPVNNKLREHKKPDLSSNLPSASDRSKSDDNLKQILSDEPDPTSHLSSSTLKATDNINHFAQTARNDSEVISDSSNESKILRNANKTAKNSANAPERTCGLLSDNQEVFSRDHVGQVSTTLPEITSVLSNYCESENCQPAGNLGQIKDNELEIDSHSSYMNDRSEIVEITKDVGTIPANEPKMSTDFAEPRSPSLISTYPRDSFEAMNSRSSPTDIIHSVIESSVKSTSMNDFYSRPSAASDANTNEPEISSDFAKPDNNPPGLISPNPMESVESPNPVDFVETPGLISPNPMESVQTTDSRSSPTVFNPTIVVDSSNKDSCMDDFYSRPSTSKEADYVEMLLSSTIPGNTLEEIYKESYRLPLDDLTRKSIENHQNFLLSKKIANSIPDSELPIPVINSRERDSCLDKGNDSDSTASFPDRSHKPDPKKNSGPKHKRSHLEKEDDFDSAASFPDKSHKPDPKKDSAPKYKSSRLVKEDYSDSTSSFPDKSLKPDTKKDSLPKHRSNDEEKLELRIKWLENYLGKLNKKIKKLQSKELSLDDLDDDDSAYIIEDRYKKKFQKVYTQLCKLKKASPRVGRKIEKHFSYEGTRYQAINKAIERLINKKKATEKFPDYKEIYEKVKEINEAQRCGIDRFHEEKLAQQIFKDVGRELQRRRILDEEEDIRNYCPEDADVEYDPADHDQNLQSKLISSAAEGEKKINEIIEKFVERQQQEDVVHSDVKEVVETSEEEQEDSDIPETDPATPSTDERVDEVQPEEKPPNKDLPTLITPDNDPNIIDIGSSSDASTEPGASVSESRKSDTRPSLLNGLPVYISDDIEVIEDSNQGPGQDSSPDLPSLQDIFSHCS